MLEISNTMLAAVTGGAQKTPAKAATPIKADAIPQSDAELIIRRIDSCVANAGKNKFGQPLLADTGPCYRSVLDGYGKYRDKDS